MSAANRARGARAEVAVVNYLRQWYPDARRYLAGDGRQPGDIDAIPGVSIEVKDRKQSAWPTWRQQALTEAGRRIPIVVRRTRGVPRVGAWDAEMPTSQWLSLGGLTRGVLQVECPRTNRKWVRVPFKCIVALLRDDLPAAQVAALDKVAWPTREEHPNG